MEIVPIAHIHSDFPTKFGIPRQSGLVASLPGEIVFEPAYRNADALRGLEEFSHVWLIWEFSEARREAWSPTVRPPRLGGNRRMGVFATRSPFRPNPLGLSCVKLDSIECSTPEGPVLHIAGADLMDGTPIYDIKPYIPYADSVPDARGGFADAHAKDRLPVDFPPSLRGLLPPEKLDGLIEALSLDPRPPYQDDPGRIYGFGYAGKDVRFRVEGGTVHVVEIKGE
jgi:putative methyltransferase, YaeB/AF_0241 family